MSQASALDFPNVRWNLAAYFDSIDDPRIEATWSEIHERADAFAAKYRPLINNESLTGPNLLDSIRENEALTSLIYRPLAYANLVFSTDSATPEVGAFLAQQSEKYSEVAVKILFFGLALQDLSDEVVARTLTETPELESYRHFLEVTRKYRPHKLSEIEEVLLEEVANVGTRAWVRLHEELLANHTFRLTEPSGEVVELTEPEVLALLRDHDRARRQAAADSLSAGLHELKRPLTYTYNTLLLDKKIEDRLRQHPYPEHSRHLSNELDRETVDLVMTMCREEYPLVARFYHVKRAILGLPELTHIDRYAPLFPAEEAVDFVRAESIVLESLGRFSPAIRDAAAEFFHSQWIDAQPRPGKQGGAYCASYTPDIHPVVFMNYQNKIDDVMTLAHELGHGVHASLSRRQTLVNYSTTLPLAELASTFAEMLVFERLVGEASLKDRLALYAEKVESVFATVFRQSAMFRFEQRCHEARRQEGELSSERFGEIWQEELQAMFGDSVHLGEQHRDWWLYIPHFIGSPFYVYAYSFGELLALSLFEKSKTGGEGFAQRYAELLALGGSRSPHELMAIVGVDLRSAEFWRGGFDVLRRLIETFEALWAEVQTSA